MLPKERDDHVQKIPSTTYVVLDQVLSMVVVPSVHMQPAHPEEALKLLEASPATSSLSHNKPVEHLIAGFVASAFRPTSLADETD